MMALSYTYNGAHQRSGESSSNAAYAYVPGKGTTAYGTASSINAYPTAGGATLTYDTNRNLTFDGANTLTYDVENRLVSARNASSVTSTYLYDPSGARKQSTVGSMSTLFYEDAGQEIAEYTGSWSNLIEFVRGPGDEIVASLSYQTTTFDPTYYHNDPLGSPLAATHAGAVTNTYAYGPFGETNPLAGPAFRYTGQRLDADTGLYYYRARHYAPTLGRFLQFDPIGYAGGLNLYGYVGNDPVNLTDPSGNCPMCFGAAASVAMGYGMSLITGHSYTWQNAIVDAALGAAGVGLVNKVNQVARLAQFADAIPVAKMLTATGNTESISQGVYYMAENGASYIGQGGIRANGASYATRITESAVKRFGDADAADNAIRFAVSNGNVQTSREVAEQSLINSVGGIDNGSLLNALNPIGPKRAAFMTTPGYGDITSVAVPNLLGDGAGAAVGGGIGASLSATNANAATGGLK
jgi:RHS repeat-associated protein